MIKNFEIETQPLTEYEEMVIMPKVIDALSKCIGKEYSATNRQIIDSLNFGYRIYDGRIRKIINHIRTHGIINGLIATNEGYYIATSEQELADYEQSLLGREEAIRVVRISISKQRKEMFNHNQQDMFPNHVGSKIVRALVNAYDNFLKATSR